MSDEQKLIVDFLQSKTNKTKFYFNDFLPLFPEKTPREVKKILTSCVNGELLDFWSSGSTTMYELKGASQAETGQ